MKKNKNSILLLSIYAIALVVINILVFTIFKPFTFTSGICVANFWFSYAFMTFAFLSQIGALFLYDRKGGLNAVFFGLPLSVISLIYFFVAAFFAILFMILCAFNVETPIVLVVTVQLLVLAFYAVLFILALITKNVVTDIDKKQKEKVQTIRYMVGDLDILIETATNPDIKKELLKLQEDIR
ncbi:MAG: hypothetical protein K5762_03610, partial [Bacilli bacterium]|nr:hypothetical protein [Bacilli bacterium]